MIRTKYVIHLVQKHPGVNFFTFYKDRRNDMQLNFERVARSECSRHRAQGLLHRGNVRALLQQKIGQA